MVPQPIYTLLKTHFDYSKRSVIAQVATISPHGPDLRSMGLFDIDLKGRLVFLTNTLSHKWMQLSLHPGISVLLLNSLQEVQIITRGAVELLTLDSSPELSELYWQRVPEGAKQTYCHEKPESVYSPLTSASTPPCSPKNFGILRITPHIWESLEIDVNNYPASLRIRYEWDKTRWLETRLNAI